MKILFQGDSITDMERDRNDPKSLGIGYVKFATDYIKEKHPEIDFEFVNLGISGNRTEDLLKRLQEDFIDVNPDIVSILAGINDVVYYAENRDWLDNEIFEQNYRTILEAIKTKTNAKIMMIEPFLFPVEDKLYYREDLDPKIQIIRKLANQYADVFMPLDGPLVNEYLGKDLDIFTPDGVHPFPSAAKIIAKWYAEYIEKLL